MSEKTVKVGDIEFGGKAYNFVANLTKVKASKNEVDIEKVIAENEINNFGLFGKEEEEEEESDSGDGFEKSQA